MSGKDYGELVARFNFRFLYGVTKKYLLQQLCSRTNKNVPSLVSYSTLAEKYL